MESKALEEFESIKTSLLTECICTSRVHHPNIVQALGIYYPNPEAKLPWLVIELMNTSLTGFLAKYEKAMVPLHARLSILVDVSQGLEFLHGQEIIHRDLSSNNVLLTKHLVAKISNFRTAKLIDHNRLTTLTQAPGTLYFMPPEALSVNPTYGKPVE